MTTEEKLELIDKCQAQVWELSNRQNKLFDDLITVIGETDDETIDFIWDNVYNQSHWTVDMIKNKWREREEDQNKIPDGIL